MARVKGIGIVLSGTAPAMTLMSGAMLAFAEQEVEFEVISTTGVGGLIGMLYLAPKGGDRKKALRELKNLFVSDWLYKVVPINFKVFHKYSSLAPSFYRLRKELGKALQFTISPEDPSELKRLFNDWMELWATVWTPASYEFKREAYMSHVPLVEDLVDFDKLNTLGASTTRFYLNAFSLATRRLRIFDHTKVTPEIYNGAQAMFMLFPPVATEDHDLLTTGATRDPTGLQAIWQSDERDKLTGVLAIDPLTRCFWREPTDAYDAFQLMLMNPVVALQQFIYAVYAKADALVNGLPANSPPAPMKLPQLFGIPVTTIAQTDAPRMLKWTHANAVALQEAGHRAAGDVAELLKKHADDTETLMRELTKFRYATTFLTKESRSEQLLKVFNPIITNFDTMMRHLHPSWRGSTDEPEKADSRPVESRPPDPRLTDPKSEESGPDGRQGTVR